MKELLYRGYVVRGMYECEFDGGHIAERVYKGQHSDYYTLFGINKHGQELAVGNFYQRKDALILAEELNMLVKHAC